MEGLYAQDGVAGVFPTGNHGRGGEQALGDIKERILSWLWEQKPDYSGQRCRVGDEEVEGAFLGTTLSRSG